MRRLVLLAFLVVAAMPNNAAACGIDPEGVEVGGYCWFLGVGGESCNEVCDVRGLTYHEATRTFAGSDGTLGNCEAVIAALGVTVSDSSADACEEYGCWVNPVPEAIQCTTTTTSTAGGLLSHRRACACAPRRPVPTLSTWSMAALMTALFGFGLFTLRRRSRV